MTLIGRFTLILFMGNICMRTEQHQYEARSHNKSNNNLAPKRQKVASPIYVDKKPSINNSQKGDSQIKSIAKEDSVDQLSKRIEKFINGFHIQLSNNNDSLKKKINETKCSQNLTLKISFKEFNFKFVEDSKELFTKYNVDPWSFQHFLSQPYSLAYKFCHQNRVLLVNLQYFLKALERVIVCGFQEEDQELNTRKQQFPSEEKVLVDMIQKLIELAKDNSKKHNEQIEEERQRSRASYSQNEDLINQNRDMELRLLELQAGSSGYNLEPYQPGITSSKQLPKQEIANQQQTKAEIMSLQSQLEAAKKHINQLKLQLQKKEYQILEFKSCLIEKEDLIKLQSTQIKNIPEKENISIETQTQKTDNFLYLDSQKLQLEELNSKLKQYETQIEQLKNNSLIDGQKISGLVPYKERVSYLEFENCNLRQQMQQLKSLNISLSNKLEELNVRPVRSESIYQHVTKFQGDILQSEKDKKKFMINSIQNHMSKTIFKTKLLYQFKVDRKVDFHTRIDKKSNLLIIVKTESNVLVAAYYSGIYQDKALMTQQGLLFSLTNNKYYTLNNFRNNPKKDKRETKAILGMSFDRYYLIFGNSQLRVKHDDNRLFSNFGVSNAFFQNQGQNASDLLCEGKKNQVPFSNYEIYQIFFSEDFEIKDQ